MDDILEIQTAVIKGIKELLMIPYPDFKCCGIVKPIYHASANKAIYYAPVLVIDFQDQIKIGHYYQHLLTPTITHDYYHQVLRVIAMEDHIYCEPVIYPWTNLYLELLNIDTPVDMEGHQVDSSLKLKIGYSTVDSIEVVVEFVEAYCRRHRDLYINYMYNAVRDKT